jgi:hypothetical protein
VHPVQLHIRDLIQEIVDSESQEQSDPLAKEWCDCEEFRERLRSGLHDRGVENPSADG